jgi:hypothetical protein
MCFHPAHSMEHWSFYATTEQQCSGNVCKAVLETSCRRTHASLYFLMTCKNYCYITSDFSSFFFICCNEKNPVRGAGVSSVCVNMMYLICIGMLDYISGSVVGSGTMLQVRRSWVRFPMSLDFSIGLILPAALCPWYWLSLLTEMSMRNLPGGKGRLARADSLTAICEPIV